MRQNSLPVFRTTMSVNEVISLQYRNMHRISFNACLKQRYVEAWCPSELIVVFSTFRRIQLGSPLLSKSLQSRYNIQNYMGRQKSLTVNMRTILIDWIVEVHKKFRLVPDVLYLCVNIVDRYLSQVQVARKRLQLVGITSLLIACKYEEIYPPEVRDCVYVTDRAYTRQEVLDMEVEILKELGFRISVPTSYPFLQRFLFITDASPTMKIAASYYLERVLQEYDLIDYRPSVIAAAAVCLSLNHTEIRAADGVEGSLPRVVSDF